MLSHQSLQIQQLKYEERLYLAININESLRPVVDLNGVRVPIIVVKIYRSTPLGLSGFRLNPWSRQTYILEPLEAVFTPLDRYRRDRWLDLGRIGRVYTGLHIAVTTGKDPHIIWDVYATTANTEGHYVKLSRAKQSWDRSIPGSSGKVLLNGFTSS